MTPEAYITYIAVHPEWRSAGVATFMLYHLIQVIVILKMEVLIVKGNE